MFNYLIVTEQGISAEDAVNRSHLHSSTNHTSRYVAVVPVMMSVAGVTGNLLVILAISFTRRLRSNTNKMLASLAIADLLVCILVMPLAIVQLISGIWPLENVTCVIYIFLDVCLCTCSILHMSTVSFNRYLGIAYPLRFAEFRTVRAAWIQILGIWLLSTIIASPVFFFGILDTDTLLHQGVCALKNQTFQIYGSLCAFYLPLTAMTTTYFLTVRKLRANFQSIKYSLLLKMRGFDNSHKSYSAKALPKEFSTLTASPELTSKDGGTSNQSCHDSSEGQVLPLNVCGLTKASRNVLKNRMQLIGHKLSFEPFQMSKLLMPAITGTGLSPNKSMMKSSGNNFRRQAGHKLVSANSFFKSSTKLLKSKTEEVGVIMKVGSSSKQSIVCQERKATQVLGLVFLAFVISWSPFFALNIVTAFCQSRCHVTDYIMDVAQWLGYAASIVNPIIYTIVNKHFQKAFRDMLTCKLWIDRRRSRKNLRDCIKAINRQALVLANTNYSYELYK